MRLFFKILYKKWCDFKLKMHLEFRYPYKLNYSKIKSIVPVKLKVKQGVTIEKNVLILKHLRELGSNVYIGDHTYIGLCKKIGSYSSISFNVKIGLRNHPLEYVSTSPVFYGAARGWLKENTLPITDEMLVEIGNDVLISANVIILEGVKVGDGAVIAAGAVVSKDVEPYAIVGGVPAKLIRYRFDEATRKELSASKWWDRSETELKELVDVANNPKLFVERLQ